MSGSLTSIGRSKEISREKKERTISRSFSPPNGLSRKPSASGHFLRAPSSSLSCAEMNTVDPANPLTRMNFCRSIPLIPESIMSRISRWPPLPVSCFRNSSALLKVRTWVNPADFINRFRALETDGSSSMMKMRDSEGFKHSSYKPSRVKASARLMTPRLGGRFLVHLGLILVNLAPLREMSAMSPLTSKTNAMIGSFILAKSTRSPPPMFTRATLPSRPTSHPLLA